VLFPHFDFRVIDLAGEEFTKTAVGFRTPVGTINLSVAGFQTFCLSLKFAGTEKFQVTFSSLGETWENPA
jgi:hypothetical protein